MLWGSEFFFLILITIQLADIQGNAVTLPTTQPTILWAQLAVLHLVWTTIELRTHGPEQSRYICRHSTHGWAARLRNIYGDDLSFNIEYATLICKRNHPTSQRGAG